MATRIGSSRKAKHIELKHLFIQKLIPNDIVRPIKIHTNDKPADILTKYVSTEKLHYTDTYRVWGSTPATLTTDLGNSRTNSFTNAQLANATCTLCEHRARTHTHKHTQPNRAMDCVLIAIVINTSLVSFRQLFIKNSRCGISMYFKVLLFGFRSQHRGQHDEDEFPTWCARLNMFQLNFLCKYCCPQPFWDQHSDKR